MAADLTALKIELETNMRYDDAVVQNTVLGVRQGNRQLLALLAEDEPGQTEFREVDTAAVLEALGDGVRGLTTAQIETLRLFTAGLTVDFRRQANRPDQPGLEYSTRPNRLHFTSPVNRLHYTTRPNRLHYTAPEED